MKQVWTLLRSMILTMLCSSKHHPSPKVSQGQEAKTTTWPWCFQTADQSHHFYRQDIRIPVINRRIKTQQTTWCPHLIAKTGPRFSKHPLFHLMISHFHVLAKRVDTSVAILGPFVADLRKKTKTTSWIDTTIKSAKPVTLEPHQ